MISKNSIRLEGLSIIIPTRNEEKIILNNLSTIYNHINKTISVENFELIISDFSEDKTGQLVNSYINNYHNIKYYNAKTRGIGAGLKLGISKSKYDIVVFYPIDLAYDIYCINRMIDEIGKGYDVVFGSRRCPGAIEKKPLNRRILSDIYSLLIKIILKIKIRDTQGVFALNKLKLIYFERLQSNDGFFQTELAIYGEMYQSKILEIPVNQKEPENRQTKANQFILGYFMLIKLIKSYFKIRKINY